LTQSFLFQWVNMLLSVFYEWIVMANGGVIKSDM